jgi:hypothetical protein
MLRNRCQDMNRQPVRLWEVYSRKFNAAFREGSGLSLISFSDALFFVIASSAAIGDLISPLHR